MSASTRGRPASHLRPRLRRNAIIFIASQVLFTRVIGQITNEEGQKGRPSCPPPAGLTARDLWGLWRVRVEGQPPATLLLERHATRADSVYGEVSRAGVRAQLAGDIEAGELVLDESDDGQRISAVWVARPSDGHCGRQWSGHWRAAGSLRQVPFVMQRMGDL